MWVKIIRDTQKDRAEPWSQQQQSKARITPRKILDARRDVIEIRSGPEVLHSRQKTLDVPSLNFKKNCQKSPKSFEGISTVLGRSPCVPICMWCLQAIGFSRRWIRLGASLLRPAALPALRPNRLPSAPASPLGIHLLTHPGSVGHRNVALRQSV